MATITQDQKNAVLASAAVAREHEIFHYQINIDNYTTMLAALPVGAWPAEISSWKGIDPNSITTLVPAEHQQAVSDYQYRDRVQGLLVTEGLEQGKSQRVYDALVAQLPVDTRDSLLAAAATSYSGA